MGGDALMVLYGISKLPKPTSSISLHWTMCSNKDGSYAYVRPYAWEVGTAL